MPVICHSSQKRIYKYKTKKPCCRKETVRCRSCYFPFKVRRRHYKFKSTRASKALGEMGLGELGLGEMGQNQSDYSHSLSMTVVRQITAQLQTATVAQPAVS